jgi:hypothetical protein
MIDIEPVYQIRIAEVGCAITEVIAIKIADGVGDIDIVIAQGKGVAYGVARAVGPGNATLIDAQDMGARQPGEAKLIAVGSIGYLPALGYTEAEPYAVLLTLIYKGADIIYSKALGVACLYCSGKVFPIAPEVLIGKREAKVDPSEVLVHIPPPYIEVAIGKLEYGFRVYIPALAKGNMPVGAVGTGRIVGNGDSGKQAKIGESQLRLGQIVINGVFAHPLPFLDRQRAKDDGFPGYGIARYIDVGEGRAVIWRYRPLCPCRKRKAKEKSQ